ELAICQRREHTIKRLQVEQPERQLQAGNSLQGQAVPGMLGGVKRDPKFPYLALGLQPRQLSQRVVEPSSPQFPRRWAVELIQIDIVGLQPPQRQLCRRPEVAR